MYTEMTTYYAMWETPEGGVGSAHFCAPSDAEAKRLAFEAADYEKFKFRQKWVGLKLRKSWFKVRFVAREDDGKIIYRKD